MQDGVRLPLGSHPGEPRGAGEEPDLAGPQQLQQEPRTRGLARGRLQPRPRPPQPQGIGWEQLYSAVTVNTMTLHYMCVCWQQ